MRLVTILLASFVLAAGSPASAQQVETPQSTVLFVCEHGAAKSVVAAAHFNKIAAERGLPFRAVSRGTDPDAAVPSRIREGLARDGVALAASFTPTKVVDRDIEAANYVVTFDVTLPEGPGRSRAIRWDGLPAFSDGYGPASAAIAAQVEALVRELTTPATATAVLAISGMT